MRDWRHIKAIAPDKRNIELATHLDTIWRQKPIKRIVLTPDPDYPAKDNPPFLDVQGWGIIMEEPGGQA